MKKALLIIGGLFLLIIIALAILPYAFRDKIKAKVDTELAKTVNAQVVYDVNDFSLSIFRNFPNITVSIDKLIVIAKQKEFKGDTLFAAATTRFAANLMSVIRGDKIEVTSIYLHKPVIATLTAKNGTSSWATLMITNPEDTVNKAPAEPTEFNIAFNEWEIEDGKIIYDDATLPMYAVLNHMNHKGSGDLTQEVVDIQTKTQSPSVVVMYDGITYLDKYALDADMGMNMNYVKGEYRFLKNEIKLNNFKFGFDGLIAIAGEDTRMDLTYKATETEFKNLLSLIPAVFLKDYDKIKTSGKVAFDGYVKGVMNDVSIPGYGLNLQIIDAMLQYPDLPTPVTNIGADIKVDNKDGITNNIVIDVKRFHMDMGKNPVDARVLLSGLNPYKIDANIVAKVNLGELTSIFPVDGTTLRGLFSLNANAKGFYSDSLKLMPVVDAKMAMQNGYVKTKDFPSALENVSFTSAVNSSGQMNTTKIWVDNFNMLLDKEPFSIKAYVENLDNPSYDVAIKGIVDLTKITKIYPLNGMTLSGRIRTDISTKGVMSDIEAGRYDKTATQGVMEVTNFKYNSPDLPQGLSLANASFTLSPEKMTINNMTGYAGKSDINIKGFFSNYMGYMFGKQDTTIRGSMSLASNKFDVNEWMTEKSTSQPQTQPSTGAFEVPKDIDFTFASNIKTVLYDNMTLNNMTGNIIMKDGIVRMDKIAFNTLGGNFLINGSYNSQDIGHPKFLMDMDMNQIQIAEAYKTFNSVQQLAPAAKNIEGTSSLSLNINGELDQAMMPVYSLLSGSGKALVQSAQLSGNKMLSGISNLTKLNGLDPMTLKDVNIKFQIIDGKLNVQPFDLNAGQIKMNIGGVNSLDGTIDYNVKMDVPAGAIGSAVNSAVSKLTGKVSDNPQNIKMDFKVTGNNTSPKIALLSSSAQAETKAAVKEAVINKAKEEFNNNAQVQKAKEDVEKARQEVEDKARAEAERIKKEAEQKARTEAENAIKNKLKKKLPF